MNQTKTPFDNSIEALLGVFCKWKNDDFRTCLPHDLALIFV